MISPLYTDEEIQRVCRYVENSTLRTMAERLARRCAQLDVIAKLADPDAPDLARRMVEIKQTADRSL